jgi:hypothetical protein
MIQWFFRNTIGLTLDLFSRYLRRRDATGVTIIALGAIERKAWRVKNDQIKRRPDEAVKRKFRRSRPSVSIVPNVTNPTGPLRQFSGQPAGWGDRGPLPYFEPVPEQHRPASLRPIRFGDELTLPDGSVCLNGCCVLKNGAWNYRPEFGFGPR